MYFLRPPMGVGTGCYEREAPPSAAGAPSTMNGAPLTWIKTTEELSKEGRLRTLVTEWLGVWEADADLYL
jgi:hypothetical protein